MKRACGSVGCAQEGCAHGRLQWREVLSQAPYGQANKSAMGVFGASKRVPGERDVLL